jgi:hypothetical protein
MHYAIVTRAKEIKFNRRSRISATAAGCKRRYFDWEYSLNPDSNHRAAAMALAAERGWISAGENRTLAGGVLADGSYVWVFVAGGNA